MSLECKFGMILINKEEIEIRDTNEGADDEGQVLRRGRMTGIGQ